MSSSLKMQLNSMYQTQISQNYEKAIIIHSLLNPFHYDRETVNDHISV